MTFSWLRSLYTWRLFILGNYCFFFFINLLISELIQYLQEFSLLPVFLRRMLYGCVIQTDTFTTLTMPVSDQVMVRGGGRDEGWAPWLQRCQRGRWFLPFFPCGERGGWADLYAVRLAFAMPGEVFASHLEAVSGLCVFTTLCPNLNSLEFLEPMVW